MVVSRTIDLLCRWQSNWRCVTTPYPGLNLTREVLAGQDFRITHEGHTPLLEVQVDDLADSIAYNAHDVDDAIKLG